MWYRTLLAEKNGLLSKNPLGSLLVSAQTKTRLFADFKSPEEFLKYSSGKTPPERCFYEIILGGGKQKPYFDIDMKNESGVDGEKVIENLVKAIAVVLEPKMGLSFEENILIFTSHGPKKWSYHVVLDCICFKDNQTNKGFKNKVVAEMKEYSEHVDSSVYSSKQQFRILGSRKFGSERVKIPKLNFTISGETYISKMNGMSELEILKSSLVTYTDDTVLLPFSYRNKFVFAPKIGEIDFDEGDAYFVAMDFLENCCESNIGAFEFSSRDENKIAFKRLKPSFCPLCDRVHDNQNPYIMISKRGGIYFYCRRKVNERTDKLESLFIGRTKINNEDVEKQVQEKKVAKVQKEKIAKVQEKIYKIGDRGVEHFSGKCEVSVEDYFNYMD